MRKRRLKVGQLVPGTKLRVLEHLESDSHGNQRVRIRCEWSVDGECCGVEKPMRATELTRKPYIVKSGKAKGKVVLPHRSCGCQSRRANREFWERRANKIPPGVRRTIFLMCARGSRFEDVADQRQLPLNLVRTIYCLEVRQLRPEVDRWVADNCRPGTTAGPRQWAQFLYEAGVRFNEMINRERRRAKRRKRRQPPLAAAWWPECRQSAGHSASSEIETERQRPAVERRPVVRRGDDLLAKNAADFAEHLRFLRELGIGSPAKVAVESHDPAAYDDWFDKMAGDQAPVDLSEEAEREGRGESGPGPQESPASDQSATAAHEAFVEPLSREAEEETLADEMAAEEAWLDQISEEANRGSMEKRARERR